MARTQEIRLTMRAMKRKAEEPAVEPRQAAEVQKQPTNKAGVAGRARLVALRMSRALAKRKKSRVPARSREEDPSLVPSLPEVPQSMPKIIARLQQDEREELVRFISGFGEIFELMGRRDKRKTEALEAQVAACRLEHLRSDAKQRELVKRLKELPSRLKKQNRQLKEMMNDGFSVRDERISELSSELAKEQDYILRLTDLLDEEKDKLSQLELQLRSERLKSTLVEMENRNISTELEYQKLKNEKLLAELKLLADLK